ncbi:MAG: hypothetical protein U0V72_11180 [Cytophagales bacterium]
MKRLIQFLPLKNKENPSARLVMFSIMLLFLVVILFVVNTVFLFTPRNPTIDNISNFGVWFLILFFFFYCNQESRLMWSTNILLTITMLVVFVTMIDTGGLYSVDKIYCLILICGAFLFSGKKSGLIYASLAILGLSVFYIGEKNNIWSHKNDLQITEATYVYLSYISAVIVASIILYALINLIEILEENNRVLTASNIEMLEKQLEQKQHEVKNLKTDIARDFHDAMGNKLASISSISQMLYLKNQVTVEDFKTEITRINALSKEVYDGTKDFIWAINIQKNNLFEIYLYVKDFGEKLFQSSGIDFLSEPISDDFEQFEISLSCCSQIILIFKETMTNALVHSKAQTVHFSLYKNLEQVYLEFYDEGIGFIEDELLRVNGLHNMKSRAKEAGLDLRVISGKNKGTKVLIIF